MTETEPEFPQNLFGNSPVGQLQHAIEGAEGLPAEFVAPFLLGAVSASVGRTLVMESLRGKRSRANLFIIVAAESGTGKTEVGRLVFEPLLQHDRRLRDDFARNRRPIIEAKIKEIELSLKRPAGKGSVAQEPIVQKLKEKAALESQLHEPRLLVEDCTQEALEQLLGRQAGILSLVSTDARSVMRNILGRHRGGAIDADTMVKAWSGDSISTDRITRTGIPPIPDPCLSMFLALQPDLFLEMVARKELTGSGFLPRVLPALLEVPSSAVRPFGGTVSDAVRYRYMGHLMQILEKYRGGGGGGGEMVVPRTDDARSVLEAFALEATVLEKNSAAAGGYFRRWGETACRIALCVHIAVHGVAAHEHSVDVDTATKAVALMRWFGAQQLELLTPAMEAGTPDVLNRLLNLVQSAGAPGLKVRDAWKRLGSTSAEVRLLAENCEQLEIVELPAEGGKGRPSPMILMKSATPDL